MPYNSSVKVPFPDHGTMELGGWWLGGWQVIELQIYKLDIFGVNHLEGYIKNIYLLFYDFNCLERMYKWFSSLQLNIW